MRKVNYSCIYVRLATGPVPTNRPISTSGPFPTTRPEVIHHSNKRYFPHNWAENRTSFPQMSRFPQLVWKLYVIPTTGPIPTTGLKIVRHSHKWADSHNWAENYTSFPQLGRFPQLVWKLYVIPTTGPIPTTGLKIIRHSHNWADSHNWSENYTSFPQTGQMGRFYIDSRNDLTLRSPTDTNRKSKIKKKKKKKNTFLRRATIHAHASAGNRFRAAAVASEDPIAVYVLKDRNVPLWTVGHSSELFSWSTFNIINQRTIVPVSLIEVLRIC